MRLALAAVLTLATLSASAQTEPMRPLPRWHRGVEGDYAPPQTSAARAFLYSAAATGALVGLGTAVVLLAPESQVTADGEDLRTIVQGVGGGIVYSGLLFGPAAGNLSLGAGADAERGAMIAVRSLEVGMVTGAAGLGLGLVCVLSAFDSGECALGDAVIVLLVGAAVITTAGTLAGAVYNLATIPGNARWAQRVRAAGNRVPAEAPRITVVPGYDARHGAPMLRLRVGL